MVGHRCWAGCFGGDDARNHVDDGDDDGATAEERVRTTAPTPWRYYTYLVGRQPQLRLSNHSSVVVRFVVAPTADAAAVPAEFDDADDGRRVVLVDRGGVRSVGVDPGRQVFLAAFVREDDEASSSSWRVCVEPRPYDFGTTDKVFMFTDYYVDHAAKDDVPANEADLATEPRSRALPVDDDRRREATTTREPQHLTIYLVVANLAFALCLLLALYATLARP